MLERHRVPGEEPCAAAGQRKSLVGVAQRGRADLTERSGSPPFEQREPTVDRAGHRARMGPERGHRRRAQLLAHGVERRALRRTAHSPVGLHVAVPDDGKQVAPDAAHVGRDDPEHEVRGQRGVDRVAAAGQYRQPGAGSEVVRGRDHAVRIGPRLLQPDAHANQTSCCTATRSARIGRMRSRITADVIGMVAVHEVTVDVVEVGDDHEIEVAFAHPGVGAEHVIADLGNECREPQQTRLHRAPLLRGRVGDPAQHDNMTEHGGSPRAAPRRRRRRRWSRCR